MAWRPLPEMDDDEYLFPRERFRFRPIVEFGPRSQLDGEVRDREAQRTRWRLNQRVLRQRKRGKK